MPAANLGSASTWMQIFVGSVPTCVGVGEGHVTGFPAVGAIIEAVGAEANFMLPLANGAVALADALLFGFVANGADDGALHSTPPRKTVPE